jgi:hypothetical protein
LGFSSEDSLIFGGGKNFYSGYSKNKTVFYNTAESPLIQGFSALYDIYGEKPLCWTFSTAYASLLKNQTTT